MKLYRFLLICAAAVTAACTEEPRDFDMTPAAPPAPEEQYAAPTNPLGSIVVAHRGGATESGHPDNSLAGLKYALDLKVYAVECDIYATADNRVIVAHATQGCLVNGLKPWEHTYDELCAAGTLSNGERLPLLEDFLEEVMRAGTSKLWLDVKNILVDGSSAGYTGFSARSCQLACQVIERMKARNFVEFIVTSNKTVWTLCYSAAQSAGVRAGWMGYVRVSDLHRSVDQHRRLEHLVRRHGGQRAVGNRRLCVGRRGSERLYHRQGRRRGLLCELHRPPARHCDELSEKIDRDIQKVTSRRKLFSAGTVYIENGADPR